MSVLETLVTGCFWGERWDGMSVERLWWKLRLGGSGLRLGEQDEVQHELMVFSEQKQWQSGCRRQGAIVNQDHSHVFSSNDGVRQDH